MPPAEWPPDHGLGRLLRREAPRMRVFASSRVRQSVAMCAALQCARPRQRKIKSKSQKAVTFRMGKRGKGRRSSSGGGGGKRSNPVAGRSAGVASLSTSSFRGIVDPAFLAQQAAAAAAAAGTGVRSSSARSSTGAAGAGAGAGAGAAGRANTSSKGKKSKINNKLSTSVSARQHGDDSRGASRPRKRPRIDERRQSAETETDMTQSTFPSKMEEKSRSSRPVDNRIFASFGRSTWKNCEQLTRLLMFPPPTTGTTIAGTGNNSNNDITDIDETLSTKQAALRLVFVSDAETARELAALYKPAVHPLPSYACHAKVKGGQLRNMVGEIVNIIATAPANDDDAGEGYDEVLSLRGPVLFVADHALDRLMSAFRRVAGADWVGGSKGKKKSEKSKKRKHSQSLHSGHNIGSAGNLLGIHYDAPRSGSILDIRRRSLDILSSLFRFDAGSSSVPTPEVVLDGCDAINAFAPAFTDAPMICCKNVIPSSDQSICQAIINTATRVRKAASGSQKQRAAQGKLLAHVTILEVKLLRAKWDKSKLELPKVSGLEGKISNVVEKMRILGMIGPAASCNPSEREAALTKWMDGAKGEECGGSWKGSVRRGASGDDASRNLASLLAGWKAADANNEDDEDNESSSSVLRCRPFGRGSVGARCGNGDQIPVVVVLSETVLLRLIHLMRIIVLDEISATTLAQKVAAIMKQPCSSFVLSFLWKY